MKLFSILLALCSLWSGLGVLQVVGQDPETEDYALVDCQFNSGGTQVCDCGFSKYVSFYKVGSFLDFLYFPDFLDFLEISKFLEFKNKIHKIYSSCDYQFFLGM